MKSSASRSECSIGMATSLKCIVSALWVFLIKVFTCFATSSATTPGKRSKSVIFQRVSLLCAVSRWLVIEAVPVFHRVLLSLMLRILQVRSGYSSTVRQICFPYCTRYCGDHARHPTSRSIVDPVVGCFSYKYQHVYAMSLQLAFTFLSLLSPCLTSTLFSSPLCVSLFLYLL